jgi:GNAT superfamily N-acetyltransferase
MNPLLDREKEGVVENASKKDRREILEYLDKISDEDRVKLAIHQPAFLSRFQDEINLAPNFKVYKEDDEIKGWANYEQYYENGKEYQWISRLFVKPEHRNKKIGQKILDNWMKDDKKDYALAVSMTNDKARKKYEENGFEMDKDNPYFQPNKLKPAISYLLRKKAKG